MATLPREELAGEAGPRRIFGDDLVVAIALGVALFICLLWAAVLVWAVGWLADLIWGRPPWSLLAYLGVALMVSTAAGVIGYRGCRAGPNARV